MPFSRVGWGNLTADPETGDVYQLGVGGLLTCLDRAGKVRWSRSLTEELGLISGVGGRTHSPLVDEDRLIVSFVNLGWGDQGSLRHRTYAFDKRTGELRWVSTPGDQPLDTNTQTTPVVAVIGGQRLLIEGEADGWVYALNARTGQKVWRYRLSKGALNNTVAVHGDTVFASHSEENLDNGSQGRVVAISPGVIQAPRRSRVSIPAGTGQRARWSFSHKATGRISRRSSTGPFSSPVRVRSSW